MRLLIILTLFVGLYSCGTTRSIKQINKHTQILRDKGIVIHRDTATNSIAIDSTQTPLKPIKKLNRHERKRLKDSLNHVSKMYRLTIERLQDSLKYAFKTHKQDVKKEVKFEKEETKQDKEANKTERLVHKQNTQRERRRVRAESRRSYWYLWMLSGGALTFIILSRLKRLI